MIEDAVVRGLASGLIFIAIMWMIGLAILVGTISLIVIVIKRIWYWDSYKERKAQKRAARNRQSDDWLIKAQQRQIDRYDHIPSHNQKKSNGRKKEPSWYPTGWTFNEKTQLWDPPDYLMNNGDEPPIKISREGPTFEEWKAARDAEEQKETK